MMEKPRFIRRNGRIIPIFSSNKKKDTAIKGTALVTAGAAFTIGGAYHAGKLMKKATDLRHGAIVGEANIKAANSAVIGLKQFGLRQSGEKIVKLGGRAKAISPQLDLFEVGAKIKGRAFSLGERVKAYKAAYRSKNILKGSHNFAHAAVGLGVDKLLDASGLEKKIGSEYASEMAGVITFGAMHSLSENIYNKNAHGVPLRQGFIGDLKKLKNPIKKLGKLFIKSRF